MLETVLEYLRNWFEIRGAARHGAYSVVSGSLDLDFVRYGQYYRIDGSVFNDGLHQHPDAGMTDEDFIGTVTPLAIPQAVITLAEDIARYREDNPETDKVSESFGGYSYTRAQTAQNGMSTTAGWTAAFNARLNAWRKV